MSAMQMINSRAQLLKLKDELGVRNDWHEPDEQGVDARVYGQSFDNAGFWGPSLAPYQSHTEQHVVLYKGGRPVAAVNLATLFAWATGLQEEEVVEAKAPASPTEMPDGYRVIRRLNGRVMTQVMSLGGASVLCRDMNKAAKARGESADTYMVEPFWRPKSDEAFEVVETLSVKVIGKGLPPQDVERILKGATE